MARSEVRRTVTVGFVAALATLGGCGESSEPATTASTASTSSTAPEPGPEQSTVEIYFTPESSGSDCAITQAVTRTVPSDDALAGALGELLAGPTAAETSAGLSSWFSAETADALRSVDVVEGTALVDLRDVSLVISGASSSCGSAQLMSQLDTTVLQFPGVERTLYAFEGDVTAFYEWLQGSPPDYYDPATMGEGATG